MVLALPTPADPRRRHHPRTPPGDAATIRKPDANAPGGYADVPTATVRVADASGCVTLHLHGADEVAALAPGDVFRLTGGLFTLDAGGGARLRAGRRGALARLGVADLVFSEAPDMSATAFVVDPATGLQTPRERLPDRAWAPPAAAARGGE